MLLKSFTALAATATLATAASGQVIQPGPVTASVDGTGNTYALITSEVFSAEDFGITSEIDRFEVQVDFTDVVSPSFTQIVGALVYDNPFSPGVDAFTQIDGFKAGSGDSFLGDGSGSLQFTYSLTDLASTASLAVDSWNEQLLNPGQTVKFEMFINNNGASQGTFTVSNITAVPVPEPASAALLGLGSLALLRRSRG